MLKTMRQHGITLALFAAGCTALIALVHQFTAPRIAHQLEIQQNRLFEQLLSTTSFDNQPARHCFSVSDSPLGAGSHHLYLVNKSDKPVAVIMQVSAADGYAGEIKLLVAANFSGTILGARVTEHHETPGLGDKIELRVSNWITHFSGTQIHSATDPLWAVKKDGGQFDQFTGASITPRAVVNAIKRAGLYATTLAEQADKLTPCGKQP